MNESRWQKLMREIGLGTNMDTFDKLVSNYNQRHRHYHNQDHIKATLRHLDESKHLANDPNAIEIALWFHDAVYKPFSSSNELDSANWAYKFLREQQAGEEFCSLVRSLIMVTLHDSLPNENDEKLMVDIDLSILGSKRETYAKFETWIRKEYKLIPKFLFKKKRKEVLTGFLERERIYSHNYFHEKLEERARTNITNALINLQ